LIRKFCRTDVLSNTCVDPLSKVVVAESRPDNRLAVAERELKARGQSHIFHVDGEYGQLPIKGEVQLALAVG
jgi:hypothetical protein